MVGRRITRPVKLSRKVPFVMSGLPGTTGHITLRHAGGQVDQLPSQSPFARQGHLRVPRGLERFADGHWQPIASVFHINEGPGDEFTVTLALDPTPQTLTKVVSDRGRPDMALLTAAQRAGIRTASINPTSVE